MKTTLAEPEVMTRIGKPASVIIPIAEEEALKRGMEVKSKEFVKTRVRQKLEAVNQTRNNPTLRGWRGQFLPELPGRVFKILNVVTEWRTDSSPRCNRELAGKPTFQPRTGRQKYHVICLSPRSGAGWFYWLNPAHGCTVGYYRPLLRSLKLILKPRPSLNPIGFEGTENNLTEA